MREVAQLPRTGSQEKLIINLWRNPDGGIFTRSVEIVDQVTRVRFSFNSDLKIESIFKETAVRALTDVLNDALQKRGMLIMPDLKIQLEGILLSGCRVMVTATEAGIENIMIRFVKYYGRVTALFTEGFSHRDSLAEDAVDQAIDALERVYMPLRNFSYYLSDFLERFPHVLGKQRTEFLHNISKEISTLGYFTDLISHYVSSREIVSKQRGGAPPPVSSGNIEQFIADAAEEQQRISDQRDRDENQAASR